MIEPADVDSAEADHLELEDSDMAAEVWDNEGMDELMLELIERKEAAEAAPVSPTRFTPLSPLEHLG